MVRKRLSEWRKNHPRAANVIGAACTIPGAVSSFYIVPLLKQEVSGFAWAFYLLGSQLSVYAADYAIRAINPNYRPLTAIFKGLKHVSSKILRKNKNTNYVETLGYHISPF